MADASPPASFQVLLAVPKTDYRTAIAIKHEQGMKEIATTFVLRGWQAGLASYAAPCPRCKEGEITVDIRLNPDHSFAEAPACPSLCLACEDRLDAILEPPSGNDPQDETGGRAALDKHIKAMNSRAWD